MENYLFLILVAVVGVIRWVLQAAENKRNAEGQKRGPVLPTGSSSSPAPKRAAAPQSEEERMRKFFEALGVPTAGTPPPRVPPRSVTPKVAPQKRKFLPVDPFPVPSARLNQPAPPLPPVVVAPPLASSGRVPALPPPPLPTPATTVFRASPGLPAPAAEFEVHEIELDRTEKETAGLESLASRLATPQGLREAIVLREIFGPPRSMQPLT